MGHKLRCNRVRKIEIKNSNSRIELILFFTVQIVLNGAKRWMCVFGDEVIISEMEKREVNKNKVKMLNYLKQQINKKKQKKTLFLVNKPNSTILF